MTNEEILKEFDEKFGEFEFLHKSGNAWDESPFKDFLEQKLNQVRQETLDETAKKERQYWIDLFDNAPKRNRPLDEDEVVKRFARIEIDKWDKFLQDLTK